MLSGRPRSASAQTPLPALKSCSCTPRALLTQCKPWRLAGSPCSQAEALLTFQYYSDRSGGWQLGWGMAMMVPFFYALKLVGWLRVSVEDEIVRPRILTSLHELIITPAQPAAAWCLR